MPFQPPHFLLALPEGLHVGFLFASDAAGGRREGTAALKAYLPAGLAALARVTAAVCVTAATLDLGPSFIDVQCAAFKICAVQAGYGPIGFRSVAHFNKRKAARAAGIPVRNQVDTINCSIPLEHGANRRIGCGKVQIAYKNILHFYFFLSFNCAGKTRQIRTAKLRRDYQKAL